ncbi:MAG: AbrB/MazE/SpoVT family DNA-binding domain-containing protein [Blastocatellia bacterium]|nr:AbrB/MazE/SpoVT family DNA-binding domain-containing protein [Blastocatellia bacterium]
MRNVTTAPIGEQGQMILPQEFRAVNHLEPGDLIAMIQVGNQLILIPEKERFVQLGDSIAFKLDEAGVTEEMLQEGLAEAREEITRERYPDLFSA